MRTDCPCKFSFLLKLDKLTTGGYSEKIWSKNHCQTNAKCNRYVSYYRTVAAKHMAWFENSEMSRCRQMWKFQSLAGKQINHSELK